MRVDGGLTHCEPLMQLQADLLEVPLERSEFTEATALGVAYLAGLGSGLWKSTHAIPRPSTSVKRFEPNPTNAKKYQPAFTRWKRHCVRVMEMGDEGLFDVVDRTPAPE